MGFWRRPTKISPATSTAPRSPPARHRSIWQSPRARSTRSRSLRPTPTRPRRRWHRGPGLQARSSADRVEADYPAGPSSRTRRIASSAPGTIRLAARRVVPDREGLSPSAPSATLPGRWRGRRSPLEVSATFCFTGGLRGWPNVDLARAVRPRAAPAGRRAGCQRTRPRAQRGAVWNRDVPRRRRGEGDTRRCPPGVAAVRGSRRAAHVRGRPRRAHGGAAQHRRGGRRAGHRRLRGRSRPRPSCGCCASPLRPPASRSCWSSTTRRARAPSTCASVRRWSRVACAYATATAGRAVPPGFSPTGLASIAAAHAGRGVDVAGNQPLVLATRSVGVFALVPRAKRFAACCASPTTRRRRRRRGSPR